MPARDSLSFRLYMPNFILASLWLVFGDWEKLLAIEAFYCLSFGLCFGCSRHSGFLFFSCSVVITTWGWAVLKGQWNPSF